MSLAHAPALLAASSTTVPDVSVGHLLIQMVVAISVVGGGIWLFGKFVQRRRAGTLISSKGAAMRGLSVLSRTSLGKDHLVAVVAWRDRELLIGVSGSTITLLADSTSTGPVNNATKADGGDELDELMAAVPATRPMVAASRSTNGRPNFLEALRSATLRG